ncbi:MAG: trypsin-like peptidase domain-containing protein [Elusimicrobia bacterium]|nr:trypsin-like peptidase domain-containing protein [Elusimicrobiota bacterium]
MKRFLPALAAALALAALWAVPARVFAQSSAQIDPKVIYGDDDRLDLYQVKIPQLKQLADSTVALFESGNVSESGQLTTSHYGEELQLCKEEPFYSQRTGAFCSGSLVAPDMIMTAGHCATSESSCRNVKFVFGFGIKQEGVLPENVPASEVYKCSKIVVRDQVNDGADFALIKLERKVTGHKPLAINRTGKIENGTKLFVIGHPAGLPTKVAGGAKVRDASPEGYFVANLDTYGGNSGSAVFNAKTGLVEGILVRGENDYVWKDGCRVSNKCPSEGCRGEDVTKISALSSSIPQKGGRKGHFVKASPILRQLILMANADAEELKSSLPKAE